MKRLWRICKFIFWALLALFVLDVVVVVFFSFYRPILKKADDIVILGAAIYTPSLYNRSLEGLRLFEMGDADAIVVSGGRISDKDISEARYMQKVILANAIVEVPVIIEDQSHSTYDNFKNTQEKIGKGKTIIVVSDAFHLARGVLMAEREGLHVVYWSAPKPYYYSKKDLLYYYAREVFAMIDYIPKFIFG
jgi:uncharacterized SAM-binding protein YcdF (DUF218 family)